MGKYIKSFVENPDQSVNVDLNKLRFRERKNLDAFMKYRDMYENKEEFYRDFIFSYIRGKDLFTKPGVSLKSFWFLPGKTGDYHQDLENIKEFMQEYSYLIESKMNSKIASNDDDAREKQLQNKTMRQEMYKAAGDRRASRIINIAANAITPEANIDMLEGAKSTSKISKQYLLAKYTDALIARESRVKPHWWEFSKKAAISREEKVLKDYEKYIKSVGITDNAIQFCKENFYEPKEYIKPTTTAHDRINIYNHAFLEAQILSTYEESNKLLKPDRDELILTSLLKYYKEMKEAHNRERNDVRNEYEQRKYNEEESLINNFEKTVHETFNIPRNKVSEQVSYVNNDENYYGKKLFKSNLMEPMFGAGFNNTKNTDFVDAIIRDQIDHLRKDPEYLESVNNELNTSSIIDFNDVSIHEANPNRNIIKGSKITEEQKKEHVEFLKKGNEEMKGPTVLDDSDYEPDYFDTESMIAEGYKEYEENKRFSEELIRSQNKGNDESTKENKNEPVEQEESYVDF